jgi:hypothetical protein
MDLSINELVEVKELKQQVQTALERMFEHPTATESNRIEFYKDYKAVCEKYESHKQHLRSESVEEKIISANFFVTSANFILTLTNFLKEIKIQLQKNFSMSSWYLWSSISSNPNDIKLGISVRTNCNNNRMKGSNHIAYSTNNGIITQRNGLVRSIDIKHNIFHIHNFAQQPFCCE